MLNPEFVILKYYYFDWKNLFSCTDYIMISQNIYDCILNIFVNTAFDTPKFDSGELNLMNMQWKDHIFYQNFRLVKVASYLNIQIKYSILKSYKWKIEIYTCNF